MFDDKQRSEHDFFEYVAKSYRYFLAGDDYQSQAVDDEIAQEAEDRAEEVRQRNQQLQQVSFTAPPPPLWLTLSCCMYMYLAFACVDHSFRPDPVCTVIHCPHGSTRC